MASQAVPEKVRGDLPDVNVWLALLNEQHKTVMGGVPYTVKQAWAAVQETVDLPEVGFQAEPDGVDASMRQFTGQPKFRSDDWTDAYLAALAKQASLRLVTFDRGFGQYAGLGLLTL